MAIIHPVVVEVFAALVLVELGVVVGVLTPLVREGLEVVLEGVDPPSPGRLRITAIEIPKISNTPNEITTFFITPS